MRSNFGAAQARMIGLEFSKIGFLARTREKLAARNAGNLMVQKVRARASGRPGPKIQTGGYVNSFRYEINSDFDRTTVSVGTDDPRAFRLELGFVGRDSAGRNYQQPPYPHWRPAIDEMEQIWPQMVENAVLGDLK